METTEPNQQQGEMKQPVAAGKPDTLPFKVTPLMKVALIFLGIVIVLLVLSMVLRLGKRTATVSAPSPVSQATAAASPVERKVSEFATGEAFQRFESELNAFRDAVPKVDVNDSTMVFPLLDMEVSYDK